MFDKVLDQFKTITELRDYAESQYTTIVKQSKEISLLNEEVKKLNNLIKSFNIETDPKMLTEEFKDLSDQEIICKRQLQNLRDSALNGDLTLEECKKAEIYTKLLLSIEESKKKKVGSTFKQLSEDEILKLVEDGTN